MSSRQITTILCFLLLGGGLSARAAGPTYWDWHGVEDMNTVHLDGASLDADGGLVRGLVARPLGPDGPEVVWCLVDAGDGGFYTGSGHGGIIHHTSGDGTVETVAEVPAPEVFSLVMPPKGGLLAGCGPEGQLYRIAEGGTVLELGTVPGGYIWDLLVDPDGETVWLATGSPAAVWKLSPDGDLEEYAVFDAQNVLDLTLDPNGRLLAATQGPGLVFRLERDGTPEPVVLFEAAQNEIRQLLSGPGGVIYALALQVEEQFAPAAENNTSGMLKVLNGHAAADVPRSAIYRLDESGLVEPVWTGDQDVMIAAWSSDWGWLAGTVQVDHDARAQLLALDPPAGSHRVAGWPGGDVLSLLVAPDRIVAAMAHPGAVQELLPDQGPHRALSPPVDAGRPVQWGRLRWQGSGDLDGVRWDVRGGNRSEPDETWIPWSQAWQDTDHELEMPALRYLQWRVTLPASGDGRITGVGLSAWRNNLPPSIIAFREEMVTDIEDGGLMPRSENVTQTMQSGLRVEFGQPARRDRRTEPRRADRIRPVRTFSWKGADPDGDRMIWSLEYRRADSEAWRSILVDTPVRLGIWDTTDLPDGGYHVRLSVSDEPDNPADSAGRSRRELGPFQVDNTPPHLAKLDLRLTATGFRLRIRAEDEGGVVGTALVVLPDGSLQRLDPVDLICDSDREDFDREITWPPAGEGRGVEPWRVRVEVRDLSGNLAIAEGDVR